MRRKWISMLVSVALVVGLAVLSAPKPVMAADYTWTGTTSTDWGTASNWSPSVVPGSGDTATIPDVSGGSNRYPTITTSVTIAGLTINSGASLTIGSGGSLTLTGNFTNNGNFSAGTGTVAFNGTLTISSSGTSNFYHVTLDPGASKTVSIAAGHTIYIAGNWTRSSGSFESNTSTVVFDGSGTSTLTSSYAITFHNLTVGSGKTLSLTYSGNSFNIENTLSLSDASSTFATNGRPVAFSNSSYTAILSGIGTFNFGKLTINSSKTLNAGSTSINVSGDWINNGTFTAGTGTVTFNGSTTQNLTLNTSTTFNNLTVGSDTTLVETVSTDNAAVSGTLTNGGTIRKSQSGTGNKTFGLTGVAINVTTGPPSIQVDRIDRNHDNATGTPGGSGIKTGKYWTITPTGSGYTVDITLPHSVSPDTNAKVCRYTGSGQVWDCDRTSSTANTVTRTGINTLSDWAVGNNVGPTAITLSSLTAASPLPAALPVPGLVALGGLAAVAALGIGAGLVRRRRG